MPGVSKCLTRAGRTKRRGHAKDELMRHIQEKPAKAAEATDTTKPPISALLVAQRSEPGRLCGTQGQRVE